MSEGLEALERICQFKNPRDFALKTDKGECKEWHFETIRELFPNDFDTIEKSLKALELIKKSFYVGHSGAIALTDYGFEHKEELKEALL